MAISFLSVLSQVLGWSYTTLWSISFYPQPLLNYQRRKTTGTSVDFAFINTLGHLSYLVYNVTLFFSHQIRNQYALRNSGHLPTVQINDIAYASHAILLTLITFSQYSLSSCWKIEEPKSVCAGLSKGIWGCFIACLGMVLVIVLVVITCHGEDPRTSWAAIDIIYAISYIKLIVTFIKYLPQILTNYRNQSTEGWSIFPALFDVIGGFLSILQLGIDCYQQGSCSALGGNPTKLLLGNISIFFDMVFIVQHYWLYVDTINEFVGSEAEPFLEGAEEL